MLKLIRFAAWLLVLAFASVGCDDNTPVAPAATPAPTPPAVPSPSPGVNAGNRPPIAIFKTNPEPDHNGKGVIRGVSPLQVQFNMCASHDPDGNPLVYTHDFDGDGVDDLKGFGGNNCRRSFTYVFSHVVQAQVFTPRQCLTDTDAVTGERLHDKQCATYRIEVLKK
jgi:hypothetical protein